MSCGLPQNDFPLSNENNIKRTSPVDKKYNCIAWAAGENKKWWEPSVDGWWPEGCPRTTKLSSYVAAYESQGFVSCEDHYLEEGYDKIVVYADSHGQGVHAAKQLDDIWWSSKMGTNIDIRHHLEALDGPFYGARTVYMKRKSKI